MKRRHILGGLGALLTAGCSKIAGTAPVAGLLEAVEGWNRNLHDVLGRRTALAREFTKADISPDFRGNGTIVPESPEYAAHVERGFADWRLELKGLFNRPIAFSLDQLKTFPQRTQITRHDCVEGWSAIGEWTGPQLSYLLGMAELKPEARYLVFHCADRFGNAQYYESIDLIDALHPQTIVAHTLNGEPLPVKNGAPLRMRVERQLGYKHAKYVAAIEAVARLDGIGEGKGGYWEDRAGYQWYAGI